MFGWISELEIGPKRGFSRNFGRRRHVSTFVDEVFDSGDEYIDADDDDAIEKQK